MAIYTNLKARDAGKHSLFESSLLKSTDIGRIWDARVQDESGNDIDIDNGVAIAIGEYTGNGLQEVYAAIAKTTDKIAVVGAPAIVKDAFTKAQNQAYNFYIPAGTLAKSYEVTKGDIYAVSDYSFTDASADKVAKDNYVVVDGNGAYVAQDAEPDESAYGFIGKIHSISYDSLEQVSMVRILCVKNEEV